MEIYKAKCAEILTRFRERRISYPECVAALDAALNGLMPSLAGDQIETVPDIILANNDAVSVEFKRRLAR